MGLILPIMDVELGITTRHLSPVYEEFQALHLVMEMNTGEGRTRL